jgi:predicted membrane protein
MSLLNNNDTTMLFTIILAIVTIILICYFSKTPAMNLLLHTFLGRALLILIIIYVASYNKMVGLLAVLIIILLNISIGSNNYYLEGFKQIDVVTETKKNKKNPVNIEKKEKTHIKSIEGQDHIGSEDSIRRGKPSNSIPVPDHSILESDDVLPNEPGEGAFESFHSVV